MEKKITNISISFMVLFSVMAAIPLVGGIQTQGDEATFVYHFVEGWNQITLPLEVADNSFEGLFGDLIDAGKMLHFCYQYDADAENDILTDHLEPGIGYRVYLYEDIDHSISGEPITTDLSIDLFERSNLIGWIHDDPVSAEYICASILGCTSVSILDDPIDATYLVYTPGDDSNNFDITKGMGFWVVNSADSVWNGSVLSNLAPDQPDTPDGPNSGNVRIEYSYTFSATDPDGDNISYFVDWGDGNITGWTEIYSSGESIVLSHNWSTEGTYNIRVKVKDEHDESIWSDTLSVEISENVKPEPKLEVSINEFFCFDKVGTVGATVENTGDTAASNINLSLYVEYGFLGHKVNSSVEFIVLEPNVVSDNLEIEELRGIGPITVTAKAFADDVETVETAASGWIIGRFIILIF